MEIDQATNAPANAPLVDHPMSAQSKWRFERRSWSASRDAPRSAAAQKQSAARRRTTGPRTTGLETKRLRDFAEVRRRISEIGERRFQTKERRTERAAKTGMLRKLGFRSAHSPSQAGIHHISRMFGDGAREQVAMAASKMIAAAITKNRRAIAKWRVACDG